MAELRLLHGRGRSVKTYEELVAVGAAVERRSVSSRCRFNMQNVSVEFRRELENATQVRSSEVDQRPRRGACPCD